VRDGTVAGQLDQVTGDSGSRKPGRTMREAESHPGRLASGKCGFSMSRRIPWKVPPRGRFAMPRSAIGPRGSRHGPWAHFFAGPHSSTRRNRDEIRCSQPIMGVRSRRRAPV
jgi:hypothetical protein